MLVGYPGDLGLWVEGQGMSLQEKGLRVPEHTQVTQGEEGVGPRRVRDLSVSRCDGTGGPRQL